MLLNEGKRTSMNTRLIIALVCCAILSSCTIVNQLRLRNSNDHLSPIWTEQTSLSQLETSYDGEKPYIYVTINGISGFKMLVDTGASITILQDTEKVKALNLQQGYELALSGWGDEEASPAYQTELQTLQMNQVHFEMVNIAYIPVSKTKYFLRADEAVYDGVVGHDLMKHFSWTFDKQANQITINSGSQAPPKDAVTLPIDIFFSKPYIDTNINLGQNQVFDHEVIIDTGSRHYLKLNETFLNNNEFQLPTPSITAVDFGLSGRASHQRIAVPKLRLGDESSNHINLNNIKTNLIKSDDDDEFFVIGSALLNQFITVIDYHTEELHIIQYPNNTFRTRFNLLGLELRKIISGEFVVRYIFPDIIGDSSDIKEGDLITSINGVKSQNISLEDWLEITSSNGEHKICRLRVKESCSHFSAKPFEGYSSHSR